MYVYEQQFKDDMKIKLQKHFHIKWVSSSPENAFKPQYVLHVLEIKSL